MKKNINITGVSRGIGSYLRNNLDKDYNIFGISKKIRKNIKNNYFMDLSNEKSVFSYFQNMKKKKFKIHAIVLVAGDRLTKNNEHISKNDFELMLNHNFISSTNVIENFVKVYKDFAKNSQIVVISSICGVQDIKAPIPFSVSKSALNFYCKMKSKILAKKYGIRLNVISPGNILQKNNLWDKKIKKNKKNVLKFLDKNVPLNKFCEPEEISNIVKLLISEKNKSISGSNFVIDAGQTS